MTDQGSSNAWMPTAGGVLSIIAGACQIIGAFALFLLAIFGAVGIGLLARPLGAIPIVLFGFLGFWLAITGILAVIGGVLALKRRNWGLSLAGAIAALLGGGHLLGILAIVFIAVGKKEFTS
jgi:hypothetical protein